MNQADEEQRRRAERARLEELFRYQVVQDVIDPQLSAAQRGALVRELAGREHDGPSGARVRVSQQTIRRWARAWRAGGFEALVPAPARVTPRTRLRSSRWRWRSSGRTRPAPPCRSPGSCAPSPAGRSDRTRSSQAVG